MSLRWDRIPDKFHYLREAVETCGEDTRTRHYDDTVGRHVSFIEKATQKQLAAIRRAKEAVDRRQHRRVIEDWCEKMESGRPSEKAAAWGIAGILELISNIPVEEDNLDESSAGERLLQSLPVALKYLHRPASMYGIYQFDQDVDDFLDSATAEQRDDLAAVATRVRINNHYPIVLDFLSKHDIEDSSDCACLYFLFGLLDRAGLSFD